MAQLRLYTISLNGTAGGRPFSRSGGLVVSPAIQKTGANVNRLDFVIQVGNPAANPQTGSLWFVTNRMLAAFLGDRNATSALDLVHMTHNSATGVTDIRPTTLAAASGFNLFNTGSGMTAMVYKVSNGQMRLTLGSESISGLIDLTGTLYLDWTVVNYRASISGRFKQSITL